MSEQALTWLGPVVLILLLGVMGMRTVLAEQVAGHGGDEPTPWRRPPMIRRLDMVGVLLAVALVVLLVWRVLVGLPWSQS